MDKGSNMFLIECFFPSDKSPMTSSPRKGRPKKLSTTVNGEVDQAEERKVKEEVCLFLLTIHVY